MARRARLGLLGGLLGAAVLAALLVPPIAQDPAYHRMADERSVGGIPNAWNVLSNAPFIAVGALGLSRRGSRLRPAGSSVPDRSRSAPLNLSMVFTAHSSNDRRPSPFLSSLA